MSAQYPHPENYNSAPPVSLVITVFLLVFFFVSFFSIYFCRCFFHDIANTWPFGRSASDILVVEPNATANPGLDPSLIQCFPTFTYSSVKDFRREKYGLECAICLAEFEDQDMLRLLTVCYHVFHQECIDLWLESHKTCPVCRSDLDLLQESLEKSPLLVDNSASTQDNNTSNNNNNNESSETSAPDSVVISIKEDDIEEGKEENGMEKVETSETAANHTSEDKDNVMEKLARFSRSHSTGHSLTGRRDKEDRHTLRLLDNVKIEISDRGHNSTASCIAFGELSSLVKGGVLVGEASGTRTCRSGGDINKV